MKTYCDISGKERFATKGDAERALRHGSRRHKITGCVYCCPYCHAYHLTGMSYSQSKNKRSRDKRQVPTNPDLVEQ